MKKALLSSICILILSLSGISQENFFIGTWNYEKIPDYVEIDEVGLKMANDFFKDMTVSFDEENYSQFAMGKTETGTWIALGENKYRFTSDAGYEYEVEMKAVSENQIIFALQGRDMQMIKAEENKEVEKGENALDKMKGVDIDINLLLGQWINNGQIKDGEDLDIILKHNEKELASFSFLKNGKFINRAPLEIKGISKWSIGEDNQTIILKSEEITEFYKVVLLSEKELYLYNPKVNSVLKFKK